MSRAQILTNTLVFTNVSTCARHAGSRGGADPAPAISASGIGRTHCHPTRVAVFSHPLGDIAASVGPRRGRSGHRPQAGTGAVLPARRARGVEAPCAIRVVLDRRARPPSRRCQPTPKGGSAMTFDKSVVVPLDPDATFALVTEPERRRRWMAGAARVELRPGGDYRWTVTPGHTAAGTGVGVEPWTRVVSSWGWEGA